MCHGEIVFSLLLFLILFGRKLAWRVLAHEWECSCHLESVCGSIDVQCLFESHCVWSFSPWLVMTSVNMFLFGVLVMSIIDQCCLVCDRHCPYVPGSIPLCSTLVKHQIDWSAFTCNQSLKQLEPVGQFSLLPRIVRILSSSKLVFLPISVYLTRFSALSFSLPSPSLNLAL